MGRGQSKDALNPDELHWHEDNFVCSFDRYRKRIPFAPDQFYRIESCHTCRSCGWSTHNRLAILGVSWFQPSEQTLHENTSAILLYRPKTRCTQQRTSRCRRRRQRTLPSGSFRPPFPLLACSCSYSEFVCFRSRAHKIDRRARFDFLAAQGVAS